MVHVRFDCPLVEKWITLLKGWNIKENTVDNYGMWYGDDSRVELQGVRKSTPASTTRPMEGVRKATGQDVR